MLANGVPPEFVTTLRFGRDCGLSFQSAWRMALDRLGNPDLASVGVRDPGSGWPWALAHTIDAWERAYHNEPPTLGDLACRDLVEMLR